MPFPSRFRKGLVVWLGLSLLPTPLFAQTAVGPSTRQNPTPGPITPATPADEPGPGEPGFATNLFSSSRSTLLGDMFGVRSTLGNYGISLGLQETSEVLGNVTGGVRRGADYDGLTIMSMGLDTQKAFGWEGGTFNVSALQIHGRNLSTDNLYNIQTASGIEANRATRLWEVWYQQTVLDGRMDVKVGQQSLDQEFIGSSYAGTFINTMMGWPVIPSYDLYAGGPAYPLSSLGVRVRARPTGNLVVLAGVFDDNPAGGRFYDDSQVRLAEKSGTRFNLNTGALFIAEMQYSVNQPSEGDLVRGDEAPRGGLPGVYKIGAWFDTAAFPDQRFDTAGLSLADPNSTGDARLRRRNFSIYATADQMVWQPNPGEARSVGVFTRIMGAPGDRNLINFGLNAGVVLKAPFAGRDNDSFGIGYGLATVSRSAGLLNKDAAFYAGTPGPKRSSESFIELTYQASITPWLLVQPDFQYVWNPGGGVANPLIPGKRIGNEAIFGLRTNVTF